MISTFSSEDASEETEGNRSFFSSEEHEINIRTTIIPEKNNFGFIDGILCFIIDTIPR
jgi:hypothetical protein